MAFAGTGGEMVGARFGHAPGGPVAGDEPSADLNAVRRGRPMLRDRVGVCFTVDVSASMVAMGEREAFGGVPVSCGVVGAALERLVTSKPAPMRLSLADLLCNSDDDVLVMPRLASLALHWRTTS